MRAMVSGRFFPLFLCHRVGLWVTFVRGEFAPPMTVQQAIRRSQGNLATEVFIQGQFDFPDDQDAPQ